MKYSEFLNKANIKEDKSQEQKDLEAVKQDGYALQYVTTQTPKICLEAVKQSGLALRYVTTQTPEICLEAVKQYEGASRFVKKDIFDKED